MKDLINYSPALWLDRKSIINTPANELNQVFIDIEQDLAKVDFTEHLSIRYKHDRRKYEVLYAFGKDNILEIAQLDKAPIPSKERREFYGSTPTKYWMSGLSDALMLKELVKIYCQQPIKNMYEFGSSTARVSRFFPILFPEVPKFYASDLNIHHVYWLEKFLSPLYSNYIPFVNTTLPQLPFPDNYLDLIYAGSVFSHSDHFENTWLLELSRVMSPNGICILTTHTEKRWDQIKYQNNFRNKLLKRFNFSFEYGGYISDEIFNKPMKEGKVILYDKNYPSYNTMTFHKTSYIKNEWGKFFDIFDIIDGGHGMNQEAIILKKKA